MPRSPQDLYARQISSTRGYPLWTPKPSNEFLIERPEGLRIGDVGVVTPEDGSFDALFNLCLPRNHRFHTRYGVPDSFICIRPEELETSTDFSAEPRGRVILTPSVTRLEVIHPSTDPPQRDELGASSYQFNLSSDEGALLILPEGAEQRQLMNVDIFFEQASQNAVEWYNYARNRRRRIISEDALYVITGLYKTRSWSVAAFENVAGNKSYAAHYKHVPDRGSTTLYGWETTRASLHWRAGTSESVNSVEPSQTVFIRGLKIALRNGFLGPRRISVKIDTPSMARPNPVKSLSVVRGNSWGRSGLVSRIGREGESTFQTTMHTGRSTGAAEEQAQSDMSNQDRYEGMYVEIQQVPNVPPAFHPSNPINQYLLRKDPSAYVAITCDSIWMSILEDNSLTAEELNQDFDPERVLSQNYDIVSREGAVCLERKRGALVDNQTHSRSSTPLSTDSNSASDHAASQVQVSPTRNPKDTDKQDIDILMNESKVDTESRMNTKSQSITSRIGPLNMQPLSFPRPASSDMPSIALHHELNMIVPYPVPSNLENLDAGAGFLTGSQRILNPMSTEHFDSEQPLKDHSPSTYAVHPYLLASSRGQGTWMDVQNPVMNPASSAYLEDKARNVSIEPSSPAVLFTCKWVDPDVGTVCGQEISTATLSRHLANIHGIASVSREGIMRCRWHGCVLTKGVRKKNITRHVREVHLGFRRLDMDNTAGRRAVLADTIPSAGTESHRPLTPTDCTLRCDYGAAQ